MNMLLTLAYLFCIGAVLGWVLEVFYRTFLSPANREHRWINPGFCTGPWLPLYGNGLCILYLLAGLDRYELTGSVWADRALMLLAMLVCMTAIEYIAGILCLKIAKVRLWDYSGCWGNVQGIICPMFSLIWGALGAAYYFGIHPLLLRALEQLSEHLTLSFFLGLFYGVFLVDLVHSAQLVGRMKAFAEEHGVVVRYEELKLHIRRFRERAGQRAHFLFAFHTDLTLAEHLKAAKEAWEQRHGVS